MSRTLDQVALNDWYVVAALSNLEGNQTRRTRLLGQDIVVGTDADKLKAAPCLEPAFTRLRGDDQ